MKMDNEIVGKRIKVRPAAFCALILAVLALLARPGFYNSEARVDESDVKKVEAEMASIEDKIENLDAKMKNTKNDLASELKNKEYIDTKLNLVSQNVEKVNRYISLLDGQIAQKNLDIADKEESIKQKYAEFEEWIKLVYENGEMNYLQILADTENLSDFLSNTEQVSSIIDYQNNLMNDLNRELEDLKTKKTELEDEMSKQNKAKQDLVTKQADYESLAAESASYISDLRYNQKLLDAQKQENQRQLDALNAELAELLAAIAKQNTVYIGGNYIWPLPSDCTKSSSGYGWRGGEFHLGIDLPAPYGTDVYAANGGNVLKAEYHYSYGYYVLIDHGGGQATLYAHCSKLYVSKGDTVSQGSVIAAVGSTGSSTGNHLHFEVRINGSTVDPTGYVSP